MSMQKDEALIVGFVLGMAATLAVGLLVFLGVAI